MARTVNLLRPTVDAKKLFAFIALPLPRS